MTQEKLNFNITKNLGSFLIVISVEKNAMLAKTLNSSVNNIEFKSFKKAKILLLEAYLLKRY